MKKLNCIFILLFSFFSSYSQIYEEYNFENLTFGSLNNQDNWVIYSNFSTLTTFNVCPAAPGSEIPTEVLNTPNLGSYNNEKAIVFNGYNPGQFSTASRKNNQNWSIPNLENEKYLFFDFVFGNGLEYKELRLAYDKNNDGDYAIDCMTSDNDELGLGLITKMDAFGNYILELYTNSYDPVASCPLPTNNIAEYRVFVDFVANNNHGSISVFYKEFGLTENWQIIPSLQNINADLVVNGENPSNRANLDGIYIRQGTGLNSFVDNIQLQTISKNNNIDICFGDSTNVNYELDEVSFLWNDNSINSSNYLNEQSNHYVEINFNNFIIVTDTITLNIIPFGNPDLGPDLSICVGDIELLNIENTSNVVYKWQDGSNLNSFLVTDTGYYNVEVNNLGCYSYDTIYINNKPMPIVELGNDTIICNEELDFILTAETNGTSFKWQDGSTLDNFSVKNEGLYTLEVALDQCVSKDSIIVRSRSRIKLGNDTTICEGEPFFLMVDAIYDDYSCFDGFKEPIKIANYNSEQWLNVTLDGCKMYSDTIKIKVKLIPIITSISKDTIICENESIDIKVSGESYESILWHNFSEDTITSVEGKGDYWVRLSNKCGFTVDTISVETENCNCKAFIPNAFSPNKDLLNDYYQYQFNCDVYRFNHKIFDKWGNIIFESTDQNNKWDGSCNNVKCQSGVYVSRFEFFYKNASEQTEITRKILLNQ
ncbi:MAG: gliding motility-associated C-terminal domain-containing protein [Flavobacteriales bacterium]